MISFFRQKVNILRIKWSKEISLTSTVYTMQVYKRTTRCFCEINYIKYLYAHFLLSVRRIERRFLFFRLFSFEDDRWKTLFLLPKKQEKNILKKFFQKHPPRIVSHFKQVKGFLIFFSKYPHFFASRFKQVRA